MYAKPLEDDPRIFEHFRLARARIGLDDEIEKLCGDFFELCTERVFVLARELVHRAVRFEREPVRTLEYRQMVILGHGFG